MAWSTGRRISWSKRSESRKASALQRPAGHRPSRIWFFNACVSTATTASSTRCKDVSFSLKRGQSLGLIGENGSGKTTLLRILAGITQADAGEIRIGGTVAPLLAVGAGFNPYLYGTRKRADRTADARA